jgi:NAD(P)-dependent dehydrogenase (short-subunit alcohol dehydrogenase family)
VGLDVYARVRLALLLSRRILSVTATAFGRVDPSRVTSALCAVQLAYTSSKGAVLAMTRELSVIHAR